MSPLQLPREGIETILVVSTQKFLVKFSLLYHFPERGLKPTGHRCTPWFPESPLPLPREGIETVVSEFLGDGS